MAVCIPRTGAHQSSITEVKTDCDSSAEDYYAIEHTCKPS